MSGSIPPDVVLRPRLGAAASSRRQRKFVGSAVFVYCDVQSTLTGDPVPGATGLAGGYWIDATEGADSPFQPVGVVEVTPAVLRLMVPGTTPGTYTVKFDIEAPSAQATTLTFEVQDNGTVTFVGESQVPWNDVLSVGAGAGASAGRAEGRIAGAEAAPAAAIGAVQPYVEQAALSEEIATGAAEIAVTKAAQVTTDRTVTEQRATDAEAARAIAVQKAADAEAARVIAAQKATDATTAAGTATTQAGIATTAAGQAGPNATAAANAVLVNKANILSPNFAAPSGQTTLTTTYARTTAGGGRRNRVRHDIGSAAAASSKIVFAIHDGTLDGNGDGNTVDSFEINGAGSRAILPLTTSRAPVTAAEVATKASSEALVTALPNGTAKARTFQGLAADYIDTKNFINESSPGVVDERLAIRSAFSYVRNGTTIYPGVGTYTDRVLRIPPGVYVLNDSLDWTAISTYNTHIMAHGAVFISRATGKPAIDMLGSFRFNIHGLTAIGDPTAMPSSAFLIGNDGFSTNGASSFNHVSCAGYFGIAACHNIGSETTSHYRCKFQNENPDPAAFGYAADGCNRLGATSAFRTVRSAGSGVSFTNNQFIGRDIRNNGHGAAVYLDNVHNWEFDAATYILTHDAAAFRLYADSVYRSHNLSIAGLIEGVKTTNPAGDAVTGIRHLIEFAGTNTATQIKGLWLTTGVNNSRQSMFKNSRSGALDITQVDIRIRGTVVDGETVPMFDAVGITMSGRIETSTGNVNLNGLTEFNGEVCVEQLADMTQCPLGTYLIHSKTDRKIRTKAISRHCSVAQEIFRWNSKSGATK